MIVRLPPLAKLPFTGEIVPEMESVPFVPVDEVTMLKSETVRSARTDSVNNNADAKKTFLNICIYDKRSSDSKEINIR